MRFKKEHYILALIFLLALSLRLFFVVQTPYFSSDASYLNLRLTEHITENSLPLIDDQLSYSGRTLLYSPLFHYILAFFDMFLPSVFVAKIIPNIFASTLTIIIYLISRQLTNNIKISLFTSFISAFIPIYLTMTTNTLTVQSLMIPLIFYAVYCLMNISKLRYHYIFTIIFISLLHPSSLLLIIGFLFYILLMKLSNMKQDPAEMEAILFATLLSTWSVFLIFKKAFLFHGISVIWQNIPSQILRFYFTNVNIFDLLYKIGIIPFLCGVYIIFIHTKKGKNKNINLLIGLATSTFLLSWLHLLKLEQGILFLGIILTILFSQFLKSISLYLSNTKMPRLRYMLFFVIFILLIPTSILPSIIYTKDTLTFTPLDKDIEAMRWLDENTAPDSVILASPYRGHVLAYFSGRKNVMDSNFLLIKNIDDRFDDIRKIYTTPYKTDAIHLLNKYGVDYIFLSSLERSGYNIASPAYIDDERCFGLVYDKEVKIYESLCTLV